MSRPKRVLYPPRPRGKIDPILELQRYEHSGDWIAQRKFNGTRALLYVSADDLMLFDRYGKVAKYEMSKELQQSIEKMSLETPPYWFDGELLHFKTKGIKDTLVLFDVLWAENFLFGISQMKRLSMLDEICRKPIYKDEKGRYIGENLLVAEIFDKNFQSHFLEAGSSDWNEGLLLRKKRSNLNVLCNKKDNLVDWQIRVRKTHKNYAF